MPENEDEGEPVMHARFVLSGVAERCANTRRPLTRSLDSTKERAEMHSSYPLVLVAHV
jgi:hypothetical protein